jgi:hypothetical protein
LPLYQYRKSPQQAAAASSSLLLRLLHAQGHGIDPARPPETAFPYARGVARRGVALVYVACWGCKAHLDGPTQAGLQGCLVSSVRCPHGVTAMDTRNGAFEIFDFSVDLYISPACRVDSSQCMQ